MRLTLPILVTTAALAAACGTSSTVDPEPGSTTSDEVTLPEATTGPAVTLTLVTHDSFNLTESLLDDFTAETGIGVELLANGDAGAMLSQAILTKDNPLADAIFGIDNLNLGRALDADILLPHPLPLPDDVDPTTVLDPDVRAVPIDTGDVCLNWDREAFTELGIPVPETLEDLREEQYASRLVVQDPSTSSPGLAFLLATVAEYGDDWPAFWEDLRAGGVTVTSGWSDAYYGEFSGGSGEGTHPLVVSYASSPPAEVLFGPDPEAEESPIGTILGTCYRQVEFAGTLAGTEHPKEAGLLVDFLLSDAVQEDIPLNMFVFPVRPVELPELFVKFAEVAEDPYEVDPDVIEANREDWLATWVDVMQR